MLRNLFGIFSLITLCTAAKAAELANSDGPVSAAELRHDVKFVSPAEGISALNLPAALAEAAPEIEILNDQGQRIDRCSATVSSDHGHLLTAGHCLEGCLRPQQVFNGDAPVISAALIGKTCNIRIHGKVYKLPILATSGCPGFGRFGPRCSGYDYALIDASELQELLPKCVSLAKSTPVASDSTVVSLNFPAVNNRSFSNGVAQPSTGREQKASIGKIVPAQDQCLHDGVATKFSSGFPYAVLQRWISDKTVMQTNVDLLKGSSGAGLIDAKGELVGLASLFDRDVHSPTKECEGATFFTSAPIAAEQIRKSLPSDAAAKAFDCSKKDFRKASKTKKSGTDI